MPCPDIGEDDFASTFGSQNKIIINIVQDNVVAFFSYIEWHKDRVAVPIFDFRNVGSDMATRSLSWLWRKSREVSPAKYLPARSHTLAPECGTWQKPCLFARIFTFSAVPETMCALVGSTVGLVHCQKVVRPGVDIGHAVPSPRAAYEQQQ